MDQKAYLLLLCLLLFSACAPRTAAAPPPDLRVAVPAGFEAGALQAAAEAYQRDTGLHIDVVVIAGDSYSTILSTALLAGLESYDLVYLTGGSVARWAGYQVIQPPGAWADPDTAPWLAPLKVKGVLYALPAQVSVEVLWFRRDLLEAAGLNVPRTWQELEDAAQALHHPPDRYGFGMAGAELETAAEFSALLAGFGGQAVGSNRQVTLDSPAARDALAFYSGLYRSGLTQPGALSSGRSQVLELLGGGTAVFGIAPLDAAARLQDCQSSPKACLEGQPLLDWTWLPGLAANQSTGGLQAWCVPLHAVHPKAAWQFAGWLVSADGARIWAHNGGTPPNRTVLAELGPPGLALAAVENHSLALPPAVAQERMWQVFHSAVYSAVSGSAEPGQALQEAAQALEIALYQDDY